jgi:hypothetical protein
MQYSFSAQFLSDIVAIAKEIAFHQRGERKLQDVETIDDKIGLKDKFKREKQELAESPHPEEELPDIVYYALCLAAQGEYHPLLEVEKDILPRYPYSQDQIQAATLVKYRIRAEGPNSKDFERERQAIQAALQ